MTWRFAPTFCAVLFACAVPAAAQDPPADPPAHISFVDGTAVLERDGRPDTTPSNMPLLAGDRVRTQNGRVEILFADGAALHLDANTSVDFQSDELLRLIDGRIRLSIPGPDRTVSYRIDAPTGSAEIDEPGEYRVSVLRGDRDPEVELAVIRGAADLVNADGRTSLRAGERGFARLNTAPSSAYVFNSASWDAFDRWSEARRDDRRGISAQYLPEEVRPYSSSFDQYGAWRYDTSYGYVWYPRVSVGWRPYYYGRWVTLRPYGWTWIGTDRWSWATHHYGRWGFSSGVWFWIPGRTWGPAWVSWAYAPGYVSWCPLGWNDRAIFRLGYGPGYDPWRAWTVVPRHHFGGGFVNARGSAVRGFDARAFVGRSTAPDIVGYAVPRGSVPIRVAGTGGVRRGNAPVYTNLAPGASRVGVGGTRVVVGQPRSTVEIPRGDGLRSRAVPRSGSPGSDGRAVVEPRARSGSSLESPTDTTATPRADDRYAAPDRYNARSRSGESIYDARGAYDAPDRRAAPERSPGSRAVPREDPGFRSSPYGPRTPSSSSPGERDAPVMTRPSSQPDDGSRPVFGRDSGDRHRPSGDSGGGGVQRAMPRGPETSRPSPPQDRPSSGPPAGYRSAPSQERPSGQPSGQPSGGGHSRSGGQATGRAVPRGKG